MEILEKLSLAIKKTLSHILSVNLEFGKSVNTVKNHSLVFFPLSPNRFNCGISALVAYKNHDTLKNENDLKDINKIIASLKKHTLASTCDVIEKNYLGGEKALNKLVERSNALKKETNFFQIFFDSKNEELLEKIAFASMSIIKSEKKDFKEKMSNLPALDVEIISSRIAKLEDAHWCFKKEILENISNIKQLRLELTTPEKLLSAKIFKRINAILNSIDRLEVRGRDSAGISVLFSFTKDEFENFRTQLKKASLGDHLKQRTNRQVLTNNTITVHDTHTEENQHLVNISFVYKFAAEIGALGDNVEFLRNQIKNDLLLKLITDFNPVSNTVSAHTRWASVGEITEANCHPADNEPTDNEIKKSGIIHISLNGDIDNYLELKTEYEARYDKIHQDITSDTKLIPLQIEHYLKQGKNIEEAFRLAVNDFQGSHAISMHCDLAPGKLFLAQKGSGQAIFVGISPDHYIAASELYGIVEETQKFIKLNGENNGQIVVLDQNSTGGVSGIHSYYYNGQPIIINDKDIQSSEITSRDIDRQKFPHYFLKEISEAPGSVEKTLENKFKITSDTNMYIPFLDENVIPDFLEKELVENKIKKIFFIGQGTAGIAAQGCADLLNYYLSNQNIQIRALKSSELSGFSIKEGKDAKDSMRDNLVIAISQSGTTTDTNRTIDMVKACNARTLCIVNRRDSDLTFKTDGVLYTSSGRDIEMSVASTKAFYSQITAGAILGLHLAYIKKARTLEFITGEINELNALPEKMTQVLELKEEIKSSASKHAIAKNYWACVGSGANKTSADEIRIKLSELCYKTISSDYIEDKKHIDLSSEPLIIICAANTRESVLGDIIKDTAIFKAHKATPIVITTKDEDRFDIYTDQVFKIPETKEHFSPILNTLVGHIWGYYAALAINDGSEFLYKGRSDIQDVLDEFTSKGHDIYEVLLEKAFREKVAQFYNKFSQKRKENRFPSAMGLDNVSNITLLLKYLAGRLPVSDFEIDFQAKGTPSNMLNAFFQSMGSAINAMARPVDAIKHQAKTVTVGTSRIAEKFEGLLFEELAHNNILISQLTNKNVLVMKNLQEIISEIQGSIFYQISGLNLLGEMTEETKIKVLNKKGASKNEKSRVETDFRLKGTKNIIVREGNVYIGKGKKDNKNILVIPIISASPATPNIIEFILTLNIAFKNSEDVSLLKRIKALGGKLTRLKDMVLESENIQWDDKFLNLVELDELFGDTAEKVVDSIIERMHTKGS